MSTAPPPAEPLLRTLSPALAELERRMRTWLVGAHRWPLSALQKAQLEGLANDFARQAQALHLEQPLLVVILMGGTGVGKSTLLNALAGGTIAKASFQRPTTRDPVVYFHESVPPHRLDPVLQICKLATHTRPALEHKVLVDTPDLDSNDLANREKIKAILPITDVVLYVGSQEKYHDHIGWELFLQERHRHAFAFVLNKWDRCQHPLAHGVRPDEDLLRDLKREGFENPLLFRTVAQYWVDHPWTGEGAPPPRPVEGEQFPELVLWLQQGLSRLEIEAIKARGVSQLLHQVEAALAKATPPDLTQVRDKVQRGWKRLLDEEARTQSELLLANLEPYQREIEHHFAIERQGLFRGIMSTYLHWFNRLKYSGTSIRDQLLGQGEPGNAPQGWDLTAFTTALTAAASDQHLDSRQRALANRLLIEADAQGFPLELLQQTTEQTARLNWRDRLSIAVVDVLNQVEHAWSKPKGWRRLVQAVIVFVADWVPLAAAGIMGTVLIWQYTMESRPFSFGDLLLPAIVMIMVVIVLHVLISILLPLRWATIRGVLERELNNRLRSELERAYLEIPANVVDALQAERRQVEQLLTEVREVSSWLDQREKAVDIDVLYGHDGQLEAKRR